MVRSKFEFLDLFVCGGEGGRTLQGTVDSAQGVTALLGEEAGREESILNAVGGLWGEVFDTNDEGGRGLERQVGIREPEGAEGDSKWRVEATLEREWKLEGD